MVYASTVKTKGEAKCRRVSQRSFFFTPFPFYPPLLVTGNIALVCHSMAFEAAEEQQTVTGEKIGIATMRKSTSIGSPSIVVWDSRPNIHSDMTCCILCSNE